MLEKLLELDRSVFLAINGFESGVIDSIMLFFSDKFVWIPLYALVVFLLYKNLGWKKATIAVLAVLLTFGLCDQFSVLIKNLVERPRPGNEPTLEGMVKLLEGKGGLYGFVSSHAANVFGFAVVTAGILKKKLYTWLIYAWAAIVSFSRITVGKHYPLDVICGAILGALIGLLILLLFRLIIKTFFKESGTQKPHKVNSEKPCAA